jgi:sucrose-6F-phosphate phosphohydrolase
MSRSFLLVTDLDNTLVGNDTALADLNQRLSDHRQTCGTHLVYSTGRSLRLYRELTREVPLLAPDLLIAAVGTEIYGAEGDLDRTWAEQLAQGWNRDQVWEVTQQFPQLIPQPDSEQSTYKVSFFLTAAEAALLKDLQSALDATGLACQVVYSSQQDLDILSQQANKGNALRYVRQTLGFPPEQTVACGDSGNDIALFGEDTLGIVVGNARSELLEWHHRQPNPRRYLAKQDCAAGILEGLEHFELL